MSRLLSELTEDELINIINKAVKNAINIDSFRVKSELEIIVDSVKRISLYDLISKECGIKRIAHNLSLEKCPFCNAKKDEKNKNVFMIDFLYLFTCSNCHKTGDTIQFIEYLKNMDNKTAIEYLRDNYLHSDYSHKHI